jgi:hypothetical protein
MTEFVIVYVFSMILSILHSVYDRKRPFIKDLQEYFEEHVYDQIPILGSLISYISNGIFKFLIFNETSFMKISKKFNQLQDRDKILTSIFVFSLQVFVYFLFVKKNYMLVREIVSFVLNINDKSKSLLGFVVNMVGIMIEFYILILIKKEIDKIDPEKLKDIWKVFIGFIILGICVYVYYKTIHKEFIAPKLNQNETYNMVKNNLLDHVETYAYKQRVPAILVVLQIVLTIVLWSIFFTIDFINKNNKFNLKMDVKRRAITGGVFGIISVCLIPYI